MTTKRHTSTRPSGPSRLTAMLMLTAFTLSVPLALAAEEADGNGDDDSSEAEQYEEMSLEELLALPIEVSSTKAQNLFNTPSTVSVIDRTTIRLYNFRSVSEAVETLAGVSVVRTYLKRNIPTIRGLLQDHYANKVLVLIDGVPAWNAVTGEGSLDRISIDDVERIEVLKGPGSVLYGTNAYSGAINLVLRKPDKTTAGGHHAFLHGQFGDHQHFGGGGSYTYRGKNLSLLVSASGNDERGKNYNFLDEQDVWGLMEEYLRGANFTMRARYETDYGNHTLLFNGFQLEESYYGVTPRWSAGADKPHIISGYLGNYTYDINIADRVDLKLSGLFDWGHRDLSRTADDSVRARITGYRGGASLGSVIHVTDYLQFELGGDFDYRRSLEYSNYAPQTREELATNNMKHGENGEQRDVTEYSLFAQGEFKLKPLVPAVPISLLAGVRWTNNELFDSNISMRGTLVYNLAETQAIKIVAGQSYRAPTLFELYFATSSGTVFGNTDLNPETSNSIELAYLLGYEKLFVQVLGYWANYENKIFRVRRNPSDPNDTSLMYVNGGTFAAFGAELELRYQNADLFDAYLTYSFVQGDKGDELDGNDHYNFKYIPQHLLSVGLGKRLYGFNLSTMINMVGPRGAPIEDLDAQFTWDINLGYAGEHFRHELSVKNILDEDVQVPAYVRRNLNSYPTGYGRTFYYTLQASF